MLKITNKILKVEEYPFNECEGPLPSITERGQIGVEVVFSDGGKYRFALDGNYVLDNQFIICGAEADEHLRGKGLLKYAFRCLFQWAKDRGYSLFPDPLYNKPSVLSVWKRMISEGNLVTPCFCCGEEFHIEGLCGYCRENNKYLKEEASA